MGSPDATIAAPTWPPIAPVEVGVVASLEPPVEMAELAELADLAEMGEMAPMAPETPMVARLGIQPEVLRLLEVVTNMCDHVIEYIEADRVERRLMVETLTQLGHVITEGAATAAAVAAAAVAPRASVAPLDAPTAESFEAHERVIGGSMPAGPETVLDLREAEREPWNPGASATEIAVEVRGRFGDRWVDGFEICEVMTTPDGPRYRLRRNRDGVVLPELFDATSIRHIETFDQLKGDQLNSGQLDAAQVDGDQLNGSAGYWSRS